MVNTNIRKILFLIRKEFIQVFRDKPMLVVIFFMPIVQLLLLGYAVSVDIKNIATLVCDQDRSATSRELIRRFENNQYFTLEYYVTEQQEIVGYIDRGKATIAIVIPARFEYDMKRNVSPTIQLLVDGQDSNSSLVAMGYAQRIIQSYSSEILIDQLIQNPASMSNVRLVTSETRVWYNPNLQAKNFMIPGIIVILLTVITSLLTALGIVKEKEIGTLEQLNVTPIKSYQLMLGKTIPFAILGLLEISFAILVARLWYQIPIRGNLLELFGFAFVFMFTTLGMGILISTNSKTQQQALFMAWFFMLFSILMSGFIFPIDNMPRLMQYLTYINPVRYFVTVVRELFLKGSGLAHLWSQGLIMTLFSIVVITYSSIRFQKRVG
ncbi:MAG: ABC transporter permease [Candidatus Zhuqueibacterota bacterium]